MSSEDVNKELALARLSDWKDKGATLRFTYTQPPQSKFDITVEVKGVGDESISFEWIFHPTDAQGTFITTNVFCCLAESCLSVPVGES